MSIWCLMHLTVHVGALPRFSDPCPIHAGALALSLPGTIGCKSDEAPSTVQHEANAQHQIPTTCLHHAPLIPSHASSLPNTSDQLSNEIMASGYDRALSGKFSVPCAIMIV